MVDITPKEFVAMLRERADMVEKHGIDTDDEQTNMRNEWNIEVWRSVANEMEHKVVEK